MGNIFHTATYFIVSCSVHSCCDGVVNPPEATLRNCRSFCSVSSLLTFYCQGMVTLLPHSSHPPALQRPIAAIQGWSLDTKIFPNHNQIPISRISPRLLCCNCEKIVWSKPGKYISCLVYLIWERWRNPRHPRWQHNYAIDPPLQHCDTLLRL